MPKYTIRFNSMLAKAEMVKLNDECLIMIDGEGIVIADAYHTINELYEHRHALFCALCKLYDNYITPIGQRRVRCYKSKNHHPDDNKMYEDSFIVWMEVSKFTGPNDIISYHLPLSWWDKFKLIEKDNAPAYDRYTSQDILKRIMSL